MILHRMLRFAPLAITITWVVSLPFPAFRLVNGEVWHGYEVLELGWLGVICLTPAWWANPLIVALPFWWPRSTPRLRWSGSIVVALLSATTGVIGPSYGRRDVRQRCWTLACPPTAERGGA